MPAGPPIALAWLSLDGRAACGIRATDHTAVCWGEAIGDAERRVDPSAPQRDPPAASEQFSQVSITDNYACALRLDGSPVCWGFNSLHESDAPASAHYTQIAVGATFACGLDAQGTASCWGGSGAQPPPSDKLVQLSAGDECTCGVRMDGNVVCWGVCQGPDLAPTGKKLAHLTLGSQFACALLPDGSPLCWGHAPPTPADHFVQLSANYGHVCGLRADGTANCWYNPSANGVVDAPSNKHFSEVHAGATFACGLRKADNTPLCWGKNTSHQLEPPTR
jgi:hypothetical protein